MVGAVEGAAVGEQSADVSLLLWPNISTSSAGAKASG